ncbi:MAG: efflux RND transporter periplasmic adaptor subunit [Vicinamibacterales bacterium]
MCRRGARLLFLVITAFTAAAAGCGGAQTEARDQAPPAPVAISVATVTARPLTRFVSVTGTLTADDEADVAAETNGRVTATPVERGTRVSEGSELVRLSSIETEAQLHEAEANVAQIAVRLGLTPITAFEPDRVPDVANARAARDLAASDFDRVRTLFDRSLVSRSQFDLSRNQADAASRQYEVARNGAVQQYEAWRAANARLDMARKAVADSIVRAPFDGVVAERLVSAGDYVTRGTKVAVVLRVSRLRVQLTVPEQYISTVAVGRSVALEVDAFPGHTFTGDVRYVSPAVRPDSRALVVEAVVSNANEQLKPGLFATARLEQAAQTTGLVVPRSAIRVGATSSRIFVVKNGHVEERVATTGTSIDNLVEVTSGVAAGEQVVVGDEARLTDGAAIIIK